MYWPRVSSWLSWPIASAYGSPRLRANSANVAEVSLAWNSVPPGVFRLNVPWFGSDWVTYPAMVSEKVKSMGFMVFLSAVFDRSLRLRGQHDDASGIHQVLLAGDCRGLFEIDDILGGRQRRVRQTDPRAARDRRK